MALVVALDGTGRAQDVGEGRRVDDAQGLGQSRVTGRFSIRKAERAALPRVQAASEKKRRPHPAPPAKQGDHDQTKNRPQPIVAPLLAARIGNFP